MLETVKLSDRTGHVNGLNIKNFSFIFLFFFIFFFCWCFYKMRIFSYYPQRVGLTDSRYIYIYIYIYISSSVCVSLSVSVCLSVCLSLSLSSPSLLLCLCVSIYLFIYFPGFPILLHIILILPFNSFPFICFCLTICSIVCLSLLLSIT